MAVVPSYADPPYAIVVPYSTRPSASAAVDHVIVAPEVVTLLTPTPAIAGARLLTKTVDGWDSVVLPNSSVPNA
jgi:hypothetical protein